MKTEGLVELSELFVRHGGRGIKPDLKKPVMRFQTEQISKRQKHMTEKRRKMSGPNKRKQLSRADILERLREIWEVVPPNGGELTNGQAERIEFNFTLAKLWVEITENHEVSEVSAIGFISDTSEEYDEDSDDDDE